MKISFKDFTLKGTDELVDRLETTYQKQVAKWQTKGLSEKTALKTIYLVNRKELVQLILSFILTLLVGGICVGRLLSQWAVNSILVKVITIIMLIVMPILFAYILKTVVVSSKFLKKIKPKE